MHKIRVLSYNIHKGFSTLNNRFLLDEIRKVIRLVNADLVMLQEVTGDNTKMREKHDNWIPDAHFEYLADSVWNHYAYGKNSVYEHGHHGNALLSKWPITSWQNIDLSVMPTSHRGLLSARLDIGLSVFCVHLGLLAWERRQQIELLVSAIEQRVKEGEPLILAGDFNDWRLTNHKRLVENLGLSDSFLSAHGKFAKTYPAISPMLKMDRIYFRNLELVSSERLNGYPWNSLSDHCAVLSEFIY